MGLVALISWFFILKTLSGDKKLALLTCALIALDYVFVMGASYGRMDMMCAALGFAGLAAYLHLRERNLTLAVLVSHFLITASGLTHFNGLLAVAGLLFLTVYFDRRRITWRHLAIAVIPYLIGAVGWGLYIIQEPSLFFTQFTGNAATGNRLVGLAAPWTGVRLEFTDRYLVAFGFGARSAGHAGPVRLKILILVAYAVTLLGALLTRDIRRHRGYRALLILTAIYFAILTVLDGQKLSYYLVHIVPFYTAILVVWLEWCWTHRLVPDWVITLCVGGFVALQVGGALYRMRLNTYQNSFLPAAEFLKRRADQGSTIMGSAELGFELGFKDNLVDDIRLGYLSGKRPDFIVVEETYERSFDGYERTEPELYRHISRILNEESRVAYDQGFYKIYARR